MSKKETDINGNPKDDQMSWPMTALCVILVVVIIALGNWYMNRDKSPSNRTPAVTSSSH